MKDFSERGKDVMYGDWKALREVFGSAFKRSTVKAAGQTWSKWSAERILFRVCPPPLTTHP